MAVVATDVAAVPIGVAAVRTNEMQSACR